MNAKRKQPPHSRTALPNKTHSSPPSTAKTQLYKRAAICQLSVFLLALISINIFGCGHEHKGGVYASSMLPAGQTSNKLTKITVTPNQAKVACGLSTQMQALGTYSDGSSQDITQQAKWQCSDNKIASAEAGEVCGRAAGQAEITAELNGIASNKAEITVTGAEPTGYIIGQYHQPIPGHGGSG